MKIAIHQPHYFPWLGYFDKIAQVDTFVLLDDVQLEKNSYMIRNRVLDRTGTIRYVTISGETKNFLKRKYKDIQTKDIPIWTNRQINALKNYYGNAKGTSEMIPLLEDFFSSEYTTICQWTSESIRYICNLLDIKTNIIYQSSLDYDNSAKKSNLVLEICRSLRSNEYFSGNGASVEYLNRGDFDKYGIKIVFQEFKHPIYQQNHNKEFVFGLSILDMLFNCGTEDTKEIFWDNVNQSRGIYG